MNNVTVQSADSPFHPEDAAYLSKRSVDLALAYKEGVHSCDEGEIAQLLGNPVIKGGGLVQAYKNPRPPEWKDKAYYRVTFRDREANGHKTESSGSPAPAYFLSTTTTSAASPLFIVESPIKALALASNGYPDAIGLGGVDAGFFVAGTRGRHLQELLEPYFPAGRSVFIVMDAGRVNNARVALAEAKIARALLDRGCEVKLVAIPLCGGVDQGPDDFLAANGKEAFDELVARARPADPAVYGASIATRPADARNLEADLPFCAALAVGGPRERKHALKALKDYFTAKDLDAMYVRHPAHRKASPNSTGGAPSMGPWAKALMRSTKGQLLSNESNLVEILKNDPRWQGLVSFDLLANDVVWTRPPSFTQFLPRKVSEKWVDEDDVSAVAWLQKEWGFDYAFRNVRGPVVLVARQREFCPIKKRLSVLVWDGVPRVDHWLSAYCGAKSSEYTRLVGKWWLVSAVARVFNPGCQVDHALVLEGEQGVGKSSAFRVLAFDGEFFTDDLRGLGDVECAKQLRSKWICELSELAAITRKDLETVKSFVTRRIDNYRPSYGRSSMDFPRRVVFGATVNPVEGQGYLKDVTGDRRWWPVKVGEIDLVAMGRDRDQVWAEAVTLYKSGEAWHPTKDQARRVLRPEQTTRREVDAFEYPLADWLESTVRGGECVTMEKILTVGLGIAVERHGAAINRVRKALHVLGWESRNTRDHGTQYKAWFRGEDADPYVEPKPVMKDVGDEYTGMTN